jgi:hypothetical protein
MVLHRYKYILFSAPDKSLHSSVEVVLTVATEVHPSTVTTSWHPLLHLKTSISLLLFELIKTVMKAVNLFNVRILEEPQSYSLWHLHSPISIYVCNRKICRTNVDLTLKQASSRVSCTLNAG